MVNEYNKNCPNTSSCSHQDPCVDIKTRKQSLEIEMDHKERCIENRHQENRQLRNIKQALEQENSFIQEEFEKFRKKINILEDQIYSYKKNYDHQVNALSKLNNTLEKFNKENIKLIEIEVNLKEEKLETKAEINNIAVSYRDNGNLYLLYKEKDTSKIYMNTTSLSGEKNANNVFSLYNETNISSPCFICDTQKDLYDKGVFSTLQEENIAYLMHKEGVVKLSIEINAETDQPSATCDEIFKEIPYAIKVGNDTSLIDFHGYPFIGFGKFILNEYPSVDGGKGSRYVASTGILSGEKPDIGISFWTLAWRSHPILEYFEKNFYVIGGNPYPPQEAVEVGIYKELTPGFRSYSKLGTKAAEPRFPFNAAGKKEEAECLLSVNSETHAHCRLGEKIFIFPRDLFQTESVPYYIYDVNKTTITKNEVSTDFIKNVKAYSDFQVTPYEEDIIYIVLTKSTAKNFSTQIIIFNASALDN